jgi:hypothetical protein
VNGCSTCKLREKAKQRMGTVQRTNLQLVKNLRDPLIVGKKSKEPLFEEDIIDGFAILAFHTYEDLESLVKHAGKNNIKNVNSLTLGDEKPKIDMGQKINSNHHKTFNKETCLILLKTIIENMYDLCYTVTVLFSCLLIICVFLQGL